MFKFLMKPKDTTENPTTQPERTAKNRRIMQINLGGYKENPERSKKILDELRIQSAEYRLAARAARKPRDEENP